MTDSVIVHTALGSLAGITIETGHGPVERFAGVPFGTAPIGTGRFRGAQPARPWTGTRSAHEFGPAPVQAMSGPFTGSVPGMAVRQIDEDCLTLNIWRPANRSDELLPVLVWIYGGAFVIGGNALPTYDGARLAAEQGVVVVSANYRVGALGFLDLRSIPGGETTEANCGLRDQVLALQWIGTNIERFGGDPARVTVFGESAGAGSIMHLLTVPQIGGLMRSAIVQSPGIDFTQDAELSAVVATTFMKRAGATTVDDLRGRSAEAIVAAQEAVSADLLFEVGTMVFHPVVDHDFVTATPSVAIADGASGDVGLLIGYTSDEMRLFPDPRADDLDENGLAAWVRPFLTARTRRDVGDDAARSLVRSYLDAMTSTSRSKGSDVWAAIQTDGIMRQPVVRVADTRPESSSTFVYQFDWPAQRSDADLGAFHAIDLPFTFDTFDVDDWDAFVGADNDAHKLGFALRSAWAAFAEHGDPSCEPVGMWPRYESTNRSTMLLGAKSRIVDDPLSVQRTWWTGLWDPACRPAGVPV